MKRLILIFCLAITIFTYSESYNIYGIEFSDVINQSEINKVEQEGKIKKLEEVKSKLLKKQKQLEATVRNKVKVEYDEFEDYNLITAKNTPKNATISIEAVSEGKNNLIPYSMYARYEYKGPYYLNMDKLFVSVDGEGEEIEYDENDYEFVFEGIHEWIIDDFNNYEAYFNDEEDKLDIYPGDLLDRIVKSKVSKIKFLGEQRNLVKTITKSEKEAIKVMLSVYELYRLQLEINNIDIIISEIIEGKLM